MIRNIYDFVMDGFFYAYLKGMSVVATVLPLRIYELLERFIELSYERALKGGANNSFESLFRTAAIIVAVEFIFSSVAKIRKIYAK